MKSIILAVAILSGSAADVGVAVTDGELSLGSVTLGDSESQVLAALGQPVRKSDTGESIAFEYPGLTVHIGWLEQAAPGKSRYVLQLNATGQDACTPAGVCPGAPLSKALATYGQPLRSERDSGIFWEYYSSQSSCWLQLGVSGDTIGSISAACQP